MFGRSDRSGTSARPVESLPSWHTLSVGEVCAALHCSAEGLSEEEAEARLATHGANRLPETPPPSRWRIFLHQFKSALIYILLFAALVTAALALWSDTLFIMAVLTLNATIGFVQEYRAIRDIQSLRRMLKSVVRVQRAGRTHEIDSEFLVPGDLVLLESGMRVPADLRILDARGLRLDESMLTGESVPVEKRPEASLPEATPLAERRNLLFSGSTIFQGRGTALVVGTGLHTQVGMIAAAIEREHAIKPPLVVRMERFTHTIALAVLAAAALVMAIGLWHGMFFFEILLSAIAMAVSAIPEGLPVVLTIALAVGIKRMATRHVLIRHLEAVEGLGSCSVIGTDKTGTLTKNQLTVTAVHVGGALLPVSGAGYAPQGTVDRDGAPLTAAEDPLLERLVRCGALCNEGTLALHDSEWSWDGDPTDIALLSLAYKAAYPPDGLRHHFPQTNAIPFEPERRYAASFHLRPPAAEGRGLAVVKGAPERVFELCERMWLPRNEQPAAFDRALATSWAEAMLNRGYRVLALAEREDAAAVDASVTPEEPHGLTLIGLVGMTDPYREGVPDAIAAARRAGIRVVMITGDHLSTARVIATEIGLSREASEAVECGDIQALGDEALAAKVSHYRVFARATPNDKLRIVKAWQARGEFVAVTGDGVNDAPALRSANIGVAMGKSGTDIARDASDIVITDDDFSSIIAGVEEGRAVYDNVRKVISLLVANGLGEVILVLLAVLAGMPVPFLPAQLLWLNLVTAGIQDVALAFEPKERDLLLRKPRPKREPVFNRLMIERTVIASAVFGSVGFALFVWSLGQGIPLEQARNFSLNLFVLFEVFHVGNCRSETRSFFRISPFSNRLLFAGTLGAVTLHFAALHTPFLQQVLSARPLALEEWVMLGVLASSVLVVMELHKAFRHWRPLPGMTRE